MSISSRYHKTQLKLLGLVLLIISVFMSVIFYITITQEEKKLLQEEKNKLHLEVDLISGFIHESMLRHDYVEVKNFLEEWSMGKEYIISLQATLKNGFLLVDYKSKDMNQGKILKVQRDISFKNNNIQILIIKDISVIKNLVNRLQSNMIYISIFIVISLGFLLWLILTKIAIKPMNDEIEMQTLELKKLNVSLEIAKNNAQNAAKIAEDANKAKSEFLANMSHEIRTPMNAVLGFAELLFNHPLNEKQTEYVKGIQLAGKNLLNIINDILDLSKIESGNMSISMDSVNIYELVDELQALFAIKAKEKNIDFILEVDSNIPKGLLLDELKIKQIMFNLLGNAIKFTSNGYVKLKCYLTNSPTDESIVELNIVVKDTGIGIPQNQQDIIFEPFRQQNGQNTRQYGGTGLGLSITHKIVQLLSGKISLNSVQDKGSSFSIVIPSVSVAALKVEKGKNSNKQYKYSIKKSTVLLVEDVVTNREIVKGYLEDQSITILEAQNGQEGVDLAISLHPDLILMDIQMPIMDGYTAIDILKYNPTTKNIPIVALTASTMTSDEAKIRSICDGYLRKPVSRDELIDEIILHLPYTKKKLEQSETELSNIKEKIDDEELKVSESFRENILESFKAEYFEIKELMTNSDIENFCEKLLVIAKEYNENGLVINLKNIISLASSFKLEEMEVEFSKLQVLFYFR
ncbi:MAG: response regulator [Arcobacteraceae bacterium]|nr:response regulator [Arcobacteraceae bacterium]